MKWRPVLSVRLVVWAERRRRWRGAAKVVRHAWWPLWRLWAYEVNTHLTRVWWVLTRPFRPTCSECGGVILPELGGCLRCSVAESVREYRVRSLRP